MEWLDRFTKLMDILSYSTQEGLGIAEISLQTDISKSTLCRMLKDMDRHSLVFQDSVTKKYRLGTRSMLWGTQFLSRQDPDGLLTENCNVLAERTGLYTYLCRLDADEIFCIYTRQPGKERTKYFVHVGQRMPVHCTAAAKAILSFQSRSLTEDLFQKAEAQGRLQAFTVKTKTTLNELLPELQMIPETRIAQCEEELELGVSALSTPVFDNQRRVNYCLNIIGSASYIQEHRSELINELLHIGDLASEQLAVAIRLSSIEGESVYGRSLKGRE